MKEYQHVISLGHACAVAHELEHLGYREHSGPFDWQGSRSLSAKISFMKNGFESFFRGLKADNLYQTKVPSCYLIKEFEIYFVHDFNEWYPLADQIDTVVEKYQRRVSHFLKDITEPTLFVYYLFDQDDAYWIDTHMEYIMETIRLYNIENDIVFIADPSIHMNTKCFYVVNDKDTDIAYDFTKKNKELLTFLNNLPYPKEKRESNIRFYKKGLFKKTIHKNVNRVLRRYWALTKRPVYHHNLSFFE